MHAVNFQQTAEVLHQPLGQRPVLHGEQLLLSPVLQLAALVDVSVQPLNLIALGLIFFRKFLDKFRRLRTVVLWRTANGRSSGAGILINLALPYQLLHIVRIGHEIQISEFFPLGIAVHLPLVGGRLVIHGVLGEHPGAVQQGVDHDHDDGNDHADGANAIQNTL